MMRHLAYLGTFILLLSMLTLAQKIPLLSSSVTDLADLLSPQAEYELQQLIAEVEKNTTAEIAVLTIPSLEGMSKEEYATAIFEQNKIGKKDKDNGLLILISRDDREYRIEVGYGLEPYVTDAKKVDIGIKILEYYFKQEMYSEGLLAAVRAISALLQGQEDVLSAQQQTTTSPFSLTIITLFIILLIIVLLLGKYGVILFPPMSPGQRRGDGWSSGGFGRGGFGGSSGGFGGGSSGGGGFGGKY